MLTIEDFQGRKVLVVGDVMLDKYLHGSVERISPEAPIPVVKIASEMHVPGGAGNVAANVASLGGAAYLIGIVGDDASGDALTAELSKRGIKTEGIIVKAGHTTTEKTRIFAPNQQLLRMDNEAQLEGSSEQICKMAGKLLPIAEIVIISDYDKGVVDARSMRYIKGECAKRGTRIIVDPKPAHGALYENVFLITPNQKEAEQLTNGKITDDESAEATAKHLAKQASSNILITRGDKGMLLFEKDTHHTTQIFTSAREVYDVSGAGDTVIATTALALAAGATLAEAAHIANTAAGIVVAKRGTATLTRTELLAELEHDGRKVKTPEQVARITQALKAEGKKIVFTNGCFDILHQGHVSLLREAKSYGDILVVAINSDATIASLKGTGRPIMNEHERLEMLSALEFVDYVFVFQEHDPCKVISILKPDVHVKGGDYNPSDYDKMPEAKIVMDYGGQVRIVKILDGKSTTNIIRKVLEQSQRSQ